MVCVLMASSFLVSRPPILLRGLRRERSSVAVELSRGRLEPCGRRRRQTPPARRRARAPPFTTGSPVSEILPPRAGTFAGDQLGGLAPQVSGRNKGPAREPS